MKIILKESIPRERSSSDRWYLLICFCIVSGLAGFAFFVDDDGYFDNGHVRRQDFSRHIRGLQNNTQPSSMQQDHRHRRLQQKQRVFFLAGPHKTSSSSIQLNLYQWIKLGASPQLAQHFSWPSPSKRYVETGCEMNHHLESKIFYPWMEAIKGRQKKHRCIRDHYSRDQVLEMYRAEFNRGWVDEAKNLVIASEAMDFMASQRYSNPKAILQGMVQEMPWNQKTKYPPSLGNSTVTGEDEDILAIVNYRTSRSSHLVSLWHQCCMNDMSFYQYLTEHLVSVVDPIRSIDSLDLAHDFAINGIRVDLLDMSGAMAMGYDVSNVIACDILGASCTGDKQLTDVYGITLLRQGVNAHRSSQVANVRMHSEEKFNITDTQMNQIDRAIRTYDCNFVSLLNEEKVRILYGYDLLEVFDECVDVEEDERLNTRDELVQRITSIALWEGKITEVVDLDQDEDRGDEDEEYEEDDHDHDQDDNYTDH